MNQGNNEEDPYIARIKRSGCFVQHEILQDCYFAKNDWRECRKEMMEFKKCFSSNKK
jgi:cytochrome c oxidase assembly factor 4